MSEEKYLQSDNYPLGILLERELEHEMCIRDRLYPILICGVAVAVFLIKQLNLMTA